MEAAFNNNEKPLGEFSDDLQAAAQAAKPVLEELIKDKLKPFNLGRIYGFVLYQIAQEGAIALATAGIGNVAKSPWTAGKLTRALVKLGLEEERAAEIAKTLLQILARVAEGANKGKKVEQTLEKSREMEEISRRVAQGFGEGAGGRQLAKEGEEGSGLFNSIRKCLKDATCFVAGTEIMVPDEREDQLGAAQAEATEQDSQELIFAGFIALLAVVGWQYLGRRRRQTAHPAEDAFFSALTDPMEGTPPEPKEDSADSHYPHDLPMLGCLLNGKALRPSYAEYRVDVKQQSAAPVHLSSQGATMAPPQPNVARSDPAKPTAFAAKPSSFRGWNLLGRCCLVLGLLVAGFLGAHGLGLFHRAKQQSGSAGVAPQGRSSRVTIESLRVGDRIWTQQSEAATGSNTDVDPRTWRRLHLRASSRWNDGTLDTLEVETLQPPEWIARHGARLGAKVPLPLDLVEMGLPADLEAEVVADEACPPIKPGPGRVVLTTVNHLNADVHALTVVDRRGQEETLRVTGWHRFYREGDAAWVPVRELDQGDKLRGRFGPLTVVANELLPGCQRVFNLTVEGEHLFHVSSLGVLTHNIEGCAPQTTLDWNAVVPKKGPYKGQPRDVHVRLHNVDNLAKPQHGVFTGDGVNLTNEAWARAQTLGLKPDAAGNLTVPMERTVGHLGGQEGVAAKAASQPTELTSITIAVRPGTNEIITAFPSR